MFRFYHALVFACCLFLAVPVHAGLLMSSVSAAVDPYCTTNASETFCEDMASTTDCGTTSTDEACRTTWTETLAGTGSIDWTTAIGGTAICTDMGDNAVRLIQTSQDAANQAFARNDLGSSQATTYTQFFFRIESEGLGDLQYHIVAQATNATNWSAPAWNFSVFQSNVDGLLYTRFFHGATTDYGTTALSVGTWYGVRVKWIANTADTGRQWWVNYSGSTWTDEGAATSENVSVRYIYLSGIGQTQRIVTMDIDNIAIDTTNMPGDCAR